MLWKKQLFLFLNQKQLLQLQKYTLSYKKPQKLSREFFMLASSLYKLLYSSAKSLKLPRTPPKPNKFVVLLAASAIALEFSSMIAFACCASSNSFLAFESCSFSDSCFPLFPNCIDEICELASSSGNTFLSSSLYC